MSRVYGHVDGVRPGAHFNKRMDLFQAGVHATVQAGIHGDPSPDGGAFSICLSGGYEDNRDNGETITYVGAGGQDKYNEQIEDQTFDHSANQSLLVSSQTRRPVRVIRGRNKDSFYAPKRGYRYDGLYVVESAEMARGKKGFNMCFFQLRRIREEGDHPLPAIRRLDQRGLSKIRKNASKR